MTLRHLIALVSMLPCFVVGCAAPKRPLLQPSTPPLVWPTPPDTPRVQFLGELRGSDDLQRAKTFGEHWDELLHGPTPPERLVSPHAVTIHTNGQRVAVATPADDACTCLTCPLRPITALRIVRTGRLSLHLPRSRGWMTLCGLQTHRPGGLPPLGRTVPVD